MKRRIFRLRAPKGQYRIVRKVTSRGKTRHYLVDDVLRRYTAIKQRAIKALLGAFNPKLKS